MAETKVAGMKILKEIADENSEFYKRFQECALRLSNETENHMDSIEKIIKSRYNKEDELPQTIIELYNDELSIYQNIIEMMEKSNDTMSKMNTSIFKEIDALLKSAKECTGRLKKICDEIDLELNKKRKNKI